MLRSALVFVLLPLAAAFLSGIYSLKWLKIAALFVS